MKKYLNFFIFIIFGISLLSFSVETKNVLANSSDSLLWDNKQGAISQQSGLTSTKDPREIVARVIRVILGFLGIIAVVIILLGGFKYMMSKGESKDVEEALNMIKAGVIGLIIILSAFALAKFITDKAYDVVSGG